MNNRELKRDLEKLERCHNDLDSKIVSLESDFYKLMDKVESKASSYSLTLLKEKIESQEAKISSMERAIERLMTFPFKYKKGDRLKAYIVVKRVIDIENSEYGYKLFNKETSNVFFMPKEEFEKIDDLKIKKA